LGPSDTSETTLGQVISKYLSGVPPAVREPIARELSRFARWIGPEMAISRIAPIDVSRYQEHLPESSVDINGRLEPVKTFLTSLKTRKLTDVNLGAHIRLQRAPRPRTGQQAGQGDTPEVRITEQGYALLTQELTHLESDVRPQVTDELGRAYSDRDFRENAPYDAAKQKLAQVQGRIDDIRRTLSAASIYTGYSTEKVDLGTAVTLRDLAENEEVVYTVVGPGEVSPREGKISVQSPVGSALMNRQMGEIVEVQTPAGIHSFRIERIERK
jgi:transcription elongation factor GreA